MRRLIKFIIVGLLFAAFPGEISNQLLIHQSGRGFAITMANYVWFLALGFWVGNLLERRLKSRLAARLVYFLLYGFVGLMIEWFVLHVYTLQPSPVQLMMFTFWAGMLLTPRIFIEQPVSGGLRHVQRGLRRYIIVWSAISLLPFAAVGLVAPNHLAGPRNFSMLAFGVGALGLHYYFYRYFRFLRRPELEKQPDEEDVPAPRRRRRTVALTVILAVVIVIGFLVHHLWFSMPVGMGPAGPKIARESFRTVWTSRPVLLVGIGDSITDGFGASAGHSYFELLTSNPADEAPDMEGVCLKSILPNLACRKLAKAGTTSLQHQADQISRLEVQPAEVLGLVVMTTGGNDLIHAYGRTPPREGDYGATMAQAQPWIAAFDRRLSAMLDRVNESFPGGCHVFLANIYDPTDGVGDMERAGLPAWADGVRILAACNEVIARQAHARRNVHLLNLHDEFLGHGIHCTQPWREHYRSADPHYWYFSNLEDPNDRGYDAIRRMFLLEMATVLQRPDAPPASAPVLGHLQPGGG